MCVVGSGSKVIGYVRVSTEDQGASGAGLEAQRAAIEAECAHRGWELVRIVEDVVSGKTMKRPGLQEALAAARGRNVDGVVVAKLDRLSRSIVDFGKLLAEADRDGWNICAIDFGLDLSTPQGKLVANVLMSVAQWEREMAGERTRQALAVRRAQGVRLGRPRVVPDDVVRVIIARHKSGRSLRAIAAELNDDGIPTARGGGRWHPATVRAILVSRDVTHRATPRVA